MNIILVIAGVWVTGFIILSLLALFGVIDPNDWD